MRYLDLQSAKKISKIGLGTSQFGSSYWGYGESYDEKEAHLIVRRAIELGVTLFDTAEIYNSGRSERILGQALGEYRQLVCVATKLWPVLPAARIVRRRAIASAHRLRARHLDLYQVHWPNPVVSDGAIMRGMRSLQADGLIGEVGVSSYSLRRWRTAENALGCRVLSNQVGYSLVARAAELDLLPFAEHNGRVIIAHSPLAQGLLSGRYHRTCESLNRLRAASPAFQPASLDRTRDLLAVLREVADAHGAAPAQIALAWAIRSPAVVAIPGASSVRQLEDNVGAADIDLADDEYLALNTASAQFRPAVPPDARALRPRRQFAALKHSAKGAWYVAQTAWNDGRLRGPARHASSGRSRHDA